MKEAVTIHGQGFSAGGGADKKRKERKKEKKILIKKTPTFWDFMGFMGGGGVLNHW